MTPNLTVTYYDNQTREVTKFEGLQDIITKAFERHPTRMVQHFRGSVFQSSMETLLTDLVNLSTPKRAPKPTTHHEYKGYQPINKQVSDEHLIISHVDHSTVASTLQITGFPVTDILVYSQQSELDAFDKCMEYLRHVKPSLQSGGSVYYILDVNNQIRVTKTDFKQLEYQFTAYLSTVETLDALGKRGI